MDNIQAYLYGFFLASIIELIIYEAIYVYHLKRRKHFLKRIVTCAFFLGFSAFIFGWITNNILRASISIKRVEILRMVINPLVFIMVVGAIYYTYHELFSTVLYTAIAGEASYAVFASLYNLLITGTGSHSIYVYRLDPIDLYSVFFYLFSHVISLGLSYFLFARPMKAAQKEFEGTLNSYVLMIFIMVIFFLVFFQSSNVIAGSQNTVFIVMFNAFTIVFCLLILLMERFILFWISDLQEKAAIQQKYENYRVQAEIAKTSVELVNIKCHDLKHQIHAILDKKELDPSYLEEVNRAISIYDTQIKTGNDSLDVVLMEKGLQCEILGIRLTAMVDGTALNFMTTSDIYSFFGNALDNAIEHLKTEPEGSRFIRISSRQQGEMVVIRMENYASDKPSFDEKGYPITTKDNKSDHGFGMRSMEFIVNKYKGEFSFSFADNLFVLTAVFTV